MVLVVREYLDGHKAMQAFDRTLDLVYGGDFHYARPSRQSIQQSLERCTDLGRQRILVAELDGVPVARLIARGAAADSTDCTTGTIGQFESLDNQRAATELLREAIGWLRDQGVGQVIGPIEGDTWHRYRFSTGPFDEPPFFMEPYNPPYYARLWEEAGFEQLESYHSKRLDDVAPAAREFASIHERTRARGYVLESFDVRQFDRELDRLYRLSLTIFADNKLYTPISADEFRSLYVPARSLIDRRLVWFARSPDGEDVGFVFCVHDYQAAAVAMRGGVGLPAKLRFWMNKRRASAINVKSMGVIPGHRRSGIGIALVSQVYREMLEMGFRRANLCLIHDDNPSSRLDAGLGTVLRRYLLYRYRGNA